MLTSVHQPGYHSAQATAQSQRVAIAGTVINAASQEGLPQVVVRITEAPLECIQGFLEILETSLIPYPHLLGSYQRLMEGRPITPNTLKLAQVLFNTFERNQWLVAPRPDQTLTGGDGHYCFFDLPPGDYRLAATLTIPNVCQGATQGQVQVYPSDRWLAFSELDLTLSLRPCPISIPAPGLEDWLSWPSMASLHHGQTALSQRI